MPRILLFSLCILLICSSELVAQHQSLLDIINSNLSDEQKQEKLDSVLITLMKDLAPGKLADCYHDIGAKWYYRNWVKKKKKKDLINAIKYTEKALEIKRSADSLEVCSINKTIFNLGFFKRLNESIFEAINIFQELDRYGTEFCSEHLNDRDKVKWARYELGSLYIITGNYYEAIEVFKRIISRYAIGDKKNDNRRLGAVEANIQMAEIYFKLGTRRYLKKIQDYLKAAEDLNLSNDPYFDHNVARINNLRGNCFLILKDYKKASEFYPSVIEKLPITDSLNRAEVYSNLGYVFNKLKSYETAKIYLNEALKYNPGNGNVYNNLGDLYLANNDYMGALEKYNTAIILEIGKSADLPYDELPALELLEYSANKVKLLNHIVTKANGWISYYEYENKKEHLIHALETFTLADKLVDLIRAVSNEQASKLYWREKSSALYMKAVEVCFLLNQPEKAFYFMERNKALLLLEDLGQEEAKVIAQIPPLLSAREFSLKRQIFLAENTLFESEDDDKASMDSLKLLVNENKYTYQNFIDSLNTAYPDYAKYKRNPVILTYDELASKYLTNEKAVVHYILNEEDGYGLLTTNEKSILFRLEHTNQLNSNIEQFNALLVDGLSDLSTLSKKSHSLFTNIMPAAIYEQIKGKQLIIVPDYTLQRLPFETLIADADQQKYLLEDVEISYVYSMSLLDHNQGLVKNTSEQFLGVAPVNFEPLGLAALNSSQGELEGIADYFNSEVLLNTNATKVNFLDKAIYPKIIHLATHADVGQGENPWIAFSDEKMYLKEIYAIKTASDMVVLSACNTSDGNLKRGEGVMSLARGFFYSGAKSVVSSLWPVTDESGKELMISFYKNLDKGHSKSRALREAKLSYLKNVKAAELKHPFYWAGFVMLGDNAALVKSSVSFWSYTGIAVLLVLIYFFRKKLFKRLQ
ncbi:CHAT domain-containing protein [Muriicola sp. Z0-33]|uniref:CHAT domain-containing protein n=1 Tax=Muriicola sp. Z0-33 TaxID=2816957 RepID=UPI002237FF71|nr:CHAT domain-containing protein [Muriicola sp. Z0-33]MCW5516249.1 CHAT domain-containing protein [Muriicola sp. Z0-33]